MEQKLYSDTLKSELKGLLSRQPETGEQWADICALEAEIIECEKVEAEEAEEERRNNGQFGVGA